VIDVGRIKFELQGSESSRALVGMVLGLKDEPASAWIDVLDDEGSQAYVESVTCSIYDAHGNSLASQLSAQYDEGIEKWKISMPSVVSDNVGTKLLRWSADNGDKGFQFFVVVDVPVFWLMARLRSVLDKSFKSTSNTWGYSDSDLFMYLVNAIGIFNTIPPLTGYSIGNLPQFLYDVIVELAQLCALEAQSIYAIDTDLPSYSDQGISISIDHFSRLQQEYGNVAARILDNVKKIKWMMGSRPKAVVMFNPERAMNYVFTQFITPGFPYFVWGIGIYNVVFSRV